ncbi:flagellar biosynthesis protein FlhA [Haematobacter massiliensis]|uniref:Flagellar biosynthesis protein FlhA n=1 Tax=Haematobacter massiliensis TaxID=195105 RepID=A0A086Y8E2_9RHOB|nr:flagellar biosynthesis protein FlhA [Haematobacter massiliensis]KFI30542.1 flagellar biosynthesis protein FlhA [Haematobacter massiliensis]OWJ73391.1 flagellar biosynthesis protein FlhA [Haematobacter massiliensis]OWJ82327.1 flagellar biosynthesis protein FlhA [Haematobacter massiliensis]QBJ25012.1 flagellar biosynthesis protein FlhA [Haematobacter massiliensis]
MPARFDLKLLFHPTVLLAVALMAVIVMMVLPVPAFVLDIGLAASFALAILIFTITLFIERPLDFSAFPTILLATLLLRLSLNVSSTKLIIGQGHTGTAAAGHVIEGFAMFVMGGNVFLGVVIFCVLMIVNFMVITKGAGRMAEVGARFALDGMPGKQLAIDSDMAAGAIDHAEAKARRERELAETTFFGSLDGASKFVKGDAVAGLIITLLNICVGLAVGIGLHGMDVGGAFRTYAILTVGDGLVSQIPAVIVSVAAALLLSRGGSKGAVNLDFFGQLGRYPAALATVGGLMAFFALVPGMPFLPFMAGAMLLGLCAWIGFRRERRAAEPAQGPAIIEKPAEKSLGDILELDDIHVEFSPTLISMVLDPASGLDARIGNMRRHVAATFGLILPEIRLTDDATLPPGGYRIRIQGVEQAADRLEADRILALMPGGSEEALMPAGDDVREPVYGAPARWLLPSRQEEAAIAGATVVSPPEVLATHMLEVIKRNFGRLLTLRQLRRVLDEMTNLSDSTRAEANRRLIDELIPERVPMDLLLSVLRLLLEERVSIRNMPVILETIAEARPVLPNAEAVCEYVRQRLGFQLVAELRRPDGTIPLVQLAPEWEQSFSTYELGGVGGQVALPPDLFNRLANGIAEKLARAGETGVHAAVITSPLRRRFLRTVMSARGLTAPVLSFDEIGFDARPSLVGQVPA